MKKYYVYHDGDDSYINADVMCLTESGELCFTVEGRLIASFHREMWSYCKEIEMESV